MDALLTDSQKYHMCAWSCTFHFFFTAVNLQIRLLKRHIAVNSWNEPFRKILSIMILKFLICLCSLVMVHQVITNFILHNQNSHWRHGTPCSFHVLQDSVTSKEVDIYSLHMIKILLLTNTHLTFQCDFFGSRVSDSVIKWFKLGRI